MAAIKVNFCSLWNVLVVFLLLSIDECKGQSNSGGVNIIAVIISVIVIILLICISMPICIICLVIALICTCRKYKRAKQSTQIAVNSEKWTVENSLPAHTQALAIHHLPLPPIPTDHAAGEEGAAEYEYSASELKVEANLAYGTNFTINQVDYDLIEPNRAHDNAATEVDQAYELNDIIDIVANDSDLQLKTEENAAYGSKMSAEPNNKYEVIATDENIAYGQYNQPEEAADTYYI